MAGKSKYNPELVENLYALIRNGEKIYDACAKAGISYKTFNDWLKRKPEFKKGYDQADREFRKSLPPDLQYKARRSILEILEKGQELHCTEVEVHSKPIAHDENGHATKWKETFRIVRDRRQNVGIPQWVYDRVLPILPDEMQAIKLLESKGYKVIPDPEIETIKDDIAELESEKKSSTKQEKSFTTEEINYLKSAILFEKSNDDVAEHTIEVSVSPPD